MRVIYSQNLQKQTRNFFQNGGGGFQDLPLETEPLFSLSLFSSFSIYFSVFIWGFFLFFLGGGRTPPSESASASIPSRVENDISLVIIKGCIVLKQVHVYSGHFCRLFIYR